MRIRLNAGMSAGWREGIWRRCLLLAGMAALALAAQGCSPYQPKEDSASAEAESSAQEATPMVAIEEETEAPPTKRELRVPTQVKGIYLTAHVAGDDAWLESILSQMDGTEVNAVVIDVKDDSGRITFDMDLPLVDEIGADKDYIQDVGALVQKLKGRGLYVIGRVVAFRDPYLAEQKPEWCLKKADGSIFRDRKGLAWVNPYRQEVWDYLVDVGKKAGEAGFDEVQFDYIRFCTERGVQDVVFDEAETKGRSKTDIIFEFTDYAYDRLADEGIYVAADVFGAIIGSEEDSASVGQVYGEMAKRLDYICPMIYPSHYGNGSFGVQYPDTQPYPIILGALMGSREELSRYWQDGEHQAVVRPWLQDFTASYLNHYIRYREEQVRAQIQAVYDAGYDEWILWNASCDYHFGAMLSREEGEAEALARAKAREKAAEEARIAAEEASRAEESSRAEEASRAEESSRAEEASRAEESSRAEETSRAEEPSRSEES